MTQFDGWICDVRKCGRMIARADLGTPEAWRWYLKPGRTLCPAHLGAGVDKMRPEAIATSPNIDPRKEPK